MSDHEVITEVPPQLRKLVRLVARAFFQPQHIVVLDILSMYPCVTEGDLVEVLKMQSAQKQLRQVLTSLRKDKLVKSLQKMESTDVAEGGGGERGYGGVVEGEKHLRMVYYYYINYKQFVNVVKYKLDKMRKAIEAEEKKVQNRTSYICSHCGSTFADLDVDRLFDPTDGNLKCSHCGRMLEEDAPTCNTVDSRTLISRMNDQMKPITDVLRETENLNLAPEILEPEAQSIEKHLQAKGIHKGAATVGHGKEQQPWATRRTMDIYGADQAISVNIGTEEELRKQNQPAVKDRPEWMMYSTVHPSGNLVQDQPSSSSSAAASGGVELAPGVGRPTGHDIIEDLLMYERKAEPGPSGVYLGATDTAEYSSSSSDEGGEGGGGLPVPMHTWQTVASPMGSEEEEEEEDEEEEYTMKIGERVVALNEVTDEMVAQMTADEKETYTKLYQQAMSQADYY